MELNDDVQIGCWSSRLSKYETHKIIELNACLLYLTSMYVSTNWFHTLVPFSNFHHNFFEHKSTQMYRMVLYRTSSTA